MATTSLWPIHTAASRNSRAVVKQLVDYAENEEKTAKQGPVENGRNTNALQSVLGYISQEEKVGDPASAGASQKEPVQDPYMSDVEICDRNQLFSQNCSGGNDDHEETLA